MAPDKSEQQRLGAMIERFERDHPDLAQQLAEAPVLPDTGPTFRYNATVRAGTSTEATGLAFLGSGTGRAQ